MLKRIYIFGVGKGRAIVLESLIKENTELLGYIDNHAEKYADGVDGNRVIMPKEIKGEYDYIIVSVMRYRNIEEQLESLGVAKDKVIRFFSFDDAIKEDFWGVLQKDKWRVEALAFEFEKKTRPYVNNLIYELMDTKYPEKVKYPNILPAEEAVRIICEEHRSLARFGDGEFELMHMKKRARFQSVDRKLADRLKEIIRCQNEKILIAIADNYGSLRQYTTEAAEDIRAYMSPQIRQQHMQALDLEKTYYDAYLSRPYIIYKDKKKAGKKFEDLKKIWQKRDVVVVEGSHTRMGVGNNLLSDAHSVKRIIVPSENAFSRYDEILDCVKEAVSNELILLALGPTATVLAYDLAVSGLWAIDIGHLDLEYEWYCAAAKERFDIPHKCVNEVGGGARVTNLPHILREKYEKEIVCSLV